jgi:glycosyltransferase involved in cell wall biosynthesis
MRFSIVTPIFNGSRFIDETILSVVTQAGSFTIRYHVQDGGSTDGTLDKLARWQTLLAGDFPFVCNGVEFSYASAPDRGMYDAVNRGFAACDSGVMSWVNADDRYEPGAFQSVADILSKFPDIQWLCGRLTIIDEQGMLAHWYPINPFPQEAIAAGLFDERYSPLIIQQEGTFWRSDLWHTVGGLNPDFRVAGDFDLWRRFAKYTDLAIADATFGCWRQREGQLCIDKAAYHAEIDTSLSLQEKELRAETAARYGAITSRDGMRSAGFISRVLVRPDGRDWICDVMPSHVFGKLTSAAVAELNNTVELQRTRVAELENAVELQRARVAELQHSRWRQLGLLLGFAKRASFEH